MPRIKRSGALPSVRSDHRYTVGVEVAAEELTIAVLAELRVQQRPHSEPGEAYGHVEWTSSRVLSHRPVEGVDDVDECLADDSNRPTGRHRQRLRS